MPSPTDSTWPTSETSASVAEIGDLLLEDRGNFRGADIHNRAADQPAQIGTTGDHGVELFEVGFNAVDRLAIAGKIEQRAGISASHSGDNRVFACHWTLVFVTSSTGRAPRGRRRKLLESNREFRFPGAPRKPAKTSRNQGLANTAATAVQHRGL
jgi:hypothetical protein